MSARPTVVLCSGKDCRKRCEYAPLRRDLGTVATVEPVKCVGLCDSPVVVLRAGSNDAVVLDKVRTDQQRDDLVATISGSKMPRSLQRRLVTGKRRKKVLAKLGK